MAPRRQEAYRMHSRILNHENAMWDVIPPSVVADRQSHGQLACQIHCLSQEYGVKEN